MPSSSYRFPRAEARRTHRREPGPRGISQTLRTQIVGFINQVRALDLEKLPSVSETIDWARVLVLLQSTELDHETVKDTLNVLLKYEADIESTMPACRRPSDGRPWSGRASSADARGTAPLFPGGSWSRRSGIACGKHRCHEGGGRCRICRQEYSAGHPPADARQKPGRKQALGECFDLFFSQPEVKDAATPEDTGEDARPDATENETQPGGDAGAPSPELGQLAQMLMSRDRNAIAVAMANAANAASLSDIRYFTQRGISPTRILEALGIERLRDDLDALTATNPQRPNGSRPHWRRCAKTFGRSSLKPWCSTGARRPRTCATKSSATRRLLASSAGRSSR